MSGVGKRLVRTNEDRWLAAQEEAFWRRYATYRSKGYHRLKVELLQAAAVAKPAGKRRKARAKPRRAVGAGRTQGKPCLDTSGKQQGRK